MPFFIKNISYSLCIHYPPFGYLYFCYIWHQIWINTNSFVLLQYRIRKVVFRCSINLEEWIRSRTFWSLASNSPKTVFDLSNVAPSPTEKVISHNSLKKNYKLKKKLIFSEFQKIAIATAIGFCIMGFIGFFVKLIHIPINNIIV